MDTIIIAGRAVLNFAIASGVGSIVTNIIKTSTPTEIKAFNKVLISVGGYALGAAAGSWAAAHVVKEIDNTIDQIKELKGAFKK